MGDHVLVFGGLRDYLINNQNKVKEYRKKAQERVREKYSWDVDPQITQINADKKNSGK